jgi:hypothetical protein
MGLTFPTPAPPGPGPTPDLAGFADRMEYLRTQLGRDVRFYGPADIIYDPTIPASEFGDDGIPLDPLASSTTVASAGVGIEGLTLLGTARADVLFQPLSAMRRDETAGQPTGERSILNKDVIVGLDDMPMAAQATYFQVGTQVGDEWTADDDELWEIVNGKTDGFGALQRYLIFGQGTK